MVKIFMVIYHGTIRKKYVGFMVIFILWHRIRKKITIDNIKSQVETQPNQEAEAGGPYLEDHAI